MPVWAVAVGSEEEYSRILPLLLLLVLLILLLLPLPERAAVEVVVVAVVVLLLLLLRTGEEGCRYCDERARWWAGLCDREPEPLKDLEGGCRCWTPIEGREDIARRGLGAPSGSNHKGQGGKRRRRRRLESRVWMWFEVVGGLLLGDKERRGRDIARMDQRTSQ